MILDQYVRVTAQTPCPVCQRGDWCLLHSDGRKAICQRVPSGLPKGDAGYLHYLPPGAADPVQITRKPKVYLTTDQVLAYLKTAACPRNEPMLVRLAGLLKLSPDSVCAMRAGYDADKAVLTFPMHDAWSQPIGVRFRRRDGRKWSLRGGREGVFMSRPFRPDRPTFIAEGPTDAAALVEAGFANVLGRPNCSGGVAIIRELVAEFPRVPVVVLADPDEPGIVGAERLVLALPNPAIILSGPSDIREFVTKFPERTDARHAIINVLKGCSEGEWKVVAKNLPGQLFPSPRFAESLQC